MQGHEGRPNFTFLWALGALSALAWVFEPVMGRAIDTGGLIAGSMVIDHPDGLWMRGAVAGLFVLLGLYEQVTLSRVEDRARAYGDLVRNLPDAVWTAKSGGPRTFLSAHLEGMLGHPAADYARDGGRLWSDGIHPEDKARVRHAQDRLFVADVPFKLEYRVRHKNGSWVWIQDRSVFTYMQGGARHANGVITDISERRQEEERKRFAHQIDSATGLPSRELLYDRLGQALAQARRHRHQVAVLLMELVGVKSVHDSLGPQVTNPLVKEIAGRLAASVREEDTVARYDDDHLAIVLPQIAEARHASRVTQKVMQTLDAVVEVRGHQISVASCVGLSFFPTDGDDPDTLVRNAGAAMERARRRGPNSYELYTREMHEAAVRRLRMEAGLRRALEKNELDLAYQPQIDLKTGRIIGVEALLRWRTGSGETIPPGEFVPVAEETGLIMPIGAWALRTACTAARAWEKEGLPPLRMSVNAAPRQFEEGGLTALVQEILRDTGLPASRLELEITEGALMRNTESAASTLDGLKALGVRLAVDDFGTGHASLAYLKRFPIDALKIDRDFVADCPDNAEGSAIVRAVIAMAHSLRLEAIAEGVETEAQLGFLTDRGCDAAEGFLLARPSPAPGLVAMLKEREAAARSEAH
jgi:diguanylate cyclase (GGDEF)-like protein/PAS domain S-box-containing protein